MTNVYKKTIKTSKKEQKLAKTGKKRVKKGKNELEEFYTNNPGRNMFITCYSTGPPINFTNFSKQDLKDTYKKCYDNAFFEIFYL